MICKLAKVKKSRKMALFIKEISIMDTNQVTETKFGQMAQNIVEFGKIIILMAKVSMRHQMVKYIQVKGKIIKCRE